MEERIPLMKRLYEKAMQGKWEAMAEYYVESKRFKYPTIGYPITIAGDTAFHLAVHSENEKPLTDLLDVLNQQEESLGQSSSHQSPIMQQNSYGNTVLHEAAINRNFEAAKLLKDKYPRLLSIKNVLGETPFFTAAAYGETKLVKELCLAPEIFDDDSRLAEVHRQRSNSITILQATINGTHFETALMLLKLDESLAAESKDPRGITALHFLSNMPSAFRSGYHMGRLERLFYDCLPVEDDEHYENEIDLMLSEVALEDSNGTRWFSTRCNQLLKVAKVVSLSVCRFFCKGWLSMENFRNNKKKHKFALKLAELIISKQVVQQSRLGIIVDVTSVFNQSSSYEPPENKKGESKDAYTSLDDEYEPPESKNRGSTNPNLSSDHCHEPLENKNGGSKDANLPSDHSHGASHEDVHGEAQQVEKPQPMAPPVLLIAASHGIVEIVEEILKRHPQAVEVLNELGQNILHVAVMHRQKKIYDVIKHRMKLPLARLNRRIDNKGYTVLHQVANIEHYTGGTKPGPALRLQDELRWFKRIEKRIPSHYLHHCDKKKDKSAKMMFEETHKELLKNAQKWIKDTSQSCSTVAVLVATVVFAAAYTVPGDYNTKGIPNFLSNRFFKVFTVFDVVSLASSLTSLVMFLSILTSPLELYDFHRSLPGKVMFGLTLLFFSVLTTMVAFGSTIAILVQSDKKRTAILISVAACVPVAVFALMLLKLYFSYLSTVKESLKPIRKFLPWFLLPSLRREKNNP